MPRVWPSTSSATARASDTSTTTCSQLPRPPREGRQARDGPASGTHRRPVRRLRSTLRGQVPSLIVDSTVVALASIIEVLEMHLAVWRRRRYYRLSRGLINRLLPRQSGWRLLRSRHDPIRGQERRGSATSESVGRRFNMVP